MNELGKAILGIGVVLVIAGAGILFAARLGLPLGRLPGDIHFRGRNVSVYFPLGTSILVSVVLSALLYLLTHWRR